MSRPIAEATPIPKPRKDVDTFVGMSRVLLSSAAFGQLSPQEWRLYTSIAMRHDGNNNGAIVLGVREAVAEFRISKPTALAAFHRLEALGLIVRRVMGEVPLDGDGKAIMSERMASEWEVTDYWTWTGPKEDLSRKPIEPTRLYADWCPKEGKLVPGSRSPDLPKPRMPLLSKPKPEKRKAPKGPPPKDGKKPVKPKMTAAERKAFAEAQEAKWAANVKAPTQDVSGDWWHNGVKLRPQDVAYYQANPDDIAF